MSWQLILDFGNTALKATLFFNGGQKEHHLLDAPSAEAVLEIAGGKPIQAALLASVRNDDAGLESALQDFFPVHRLGPESALPVTNSYATPATLGYDRIAAAVAGWQLFPGRPVLAIVAGTCITYNFITASGVFQGGAIAPGVHMRLQAMHTFTQRLPLVAPEGELVFPAGTTETSLRAGALLAAQLEIDGFYNRLLADHPNLAGVIGGGDALLLADGLKNDIFARPFLVPEGLNRLLDHHVANLQR